MKPREMNTVIGSVIGPRQADAVSLLTGLWEEVARWPYPATMPQGPLRSDKADKILRSLEEL